MSANAAPAAPQARIMEKLNRGLVAVKQSSGVFLSWRLLGDEDLENQGFDIYRDNIKITSTGAAAATCYTDSGGKATSKYKVVKAGATPEEVEAEKDVTPWTGYFERSQNGFSNKAGYLDIKFDAPAGGTTSSGEAYTYTANDMSTGDLDGDGEYELIVKWDPSNAKDNSQGGITGNVYIDAYKLNGKRLWRLDLGPNIRAGAHYTQFLVYDFDCDGKSEIIFKTAPGSKDGQGNYVSDVGNAITTGDNTKYYGNSSGHVLDGPEWLTIFNGQTGEAMQTVNYDPPRTIKTQASGSANWGDNYGNRSERYLAGVAYLDGEKPSALFCRGYYTYAYVAAYNWDGTNLTEQWISKNENGKSWKEDANHQKVGSDSRYSLFGQGAHSVSVADVDNDGFDELIFGSAVLDHDGTVLYSDGRGHGDAEHVSDFDNDGKQEVFMVHEAGKDDKSTISYAVDIKRYNSDTKKMDDVMTQASTGDIGRGVMDNIDDTFASKNPDSLSLFWSVANGDTSLTYNIKGEEKGVSTNSNNNKFQNFLIYWDADLGRELLDHNLLAKYNTTTGIKRIQFQSDNYIPNIDSNNGTKKTPGLVADILGDWREEMVFRLADGTGARIYTSCIPTTYRLATLMHDSQYRCAVAWQNVGYNQPPHTSYYIGSASLANGKNYLAPKTPFTTVEYPEIIEVDGVLVAPKTLDLGEKCTRQLTAEITPSEATNSSVSWSTSNESAATVDGSGVVTGVKEGTAVITATVKDNGKVFTDSCTVNVYPMKSTNELGENIFETDNTDEQSILSAPTASSASFTQTDANTSGKFYRDFTRYEDNKATLEFTFNTGGKQLANSAWNWEGHEYSFHVKLLDGNDSMIDLSQAYTSGAQPTKSSVGGGAENDIKSTWSKTGTIKEEPMGRSSTKWYVTVDFDYDNDNAVITILGSDKQGGYTTSFDLNGKRFSRLEFSSTKDGSGAITWSPSVSDVSYTRTVVAIPTPTPTATPTLEPTASPSPSPTPEPTATPTPTATLSPTPTAAPTPTVSPSPTPTAAPTPTVSPSPTPTAAPTPTKTPTPEPTENPSPTPTVTPIPTENPSPTPTVTPTPTENPSPIPTVTPTPTENPSPTPTATPTLEPTPTAAPTEAPPTETITPTEAPPTDTPVPTDTPPAETIAPTDAPPVNTPSPDDRFIITGVSGNTIDVEIHNSEGMGKTILIGALYDGDRLVECKFEIIESNGAEPITKSLTFANTTENYKVKAFLWNALDGENGIKPIFDSAVYKNDEKEETN